MSKVHQKLICSRCRSEKDGTFCSLCETETPSDIGISVSEQILVRDNIKLRNFGSSTRKFLGEFLGGWFPSGDSKLPDGVHKSRTIDREKDEYHEVVKKYGTDQVIHETHEPLSKHRKSRGE